MLPQLRTSGGVALSAAVALLFLSACASTAAAPRAAQSSPSSSLSPSQSHSRPATARNPAISPADMINVADEVRKVGSTDPSFVDLAYLGGRKFVTYRCNLATPIGDEPYRQAVAASSVQLVFQSAMLCTNQIHRLDQLVMASNMWLTQHGVQTASFGGGTPGPYVIGYSESSPPSNSLLGRFLIYGPRTVVFKHQNGFTAN